MISTRPAVAVAVAAVVAVAATAAAAAAEAAAAVEAVEAAVAAAEARASGRICCGLCVRPEVELTICRALRQIAQKSPTCLYKLDFTIQRHSKRNCTVKSMLARLPIVLFACVDLAAPVH